MADGESPSQLAAQQAAQLSSIGFADIAIANDVLTRVPAEANIFAAGGDGTPESEGGNPRSLASLQPSDR
jgi:hypothetical protein